ncbi:hypothetical protein D9M68_990130 [compost metagenome]
MADRVGVIRQGEIILVEEKHALMTKLGKRQLALTLKAPLPGIPTALDGFLLDLSADGYTLVYTYDNQGGGEISRLLHELGRLEIEFTDLNSSESSLEDIFVSLVHGQS